MYNSA